MSFYQALRRTLAGLLLLGVLATSAFAQTEPSPTPPPPEMDPLLAADLPTVGAIIAADRLAARLDPASASPKEQMALGVLQVLAAIEHLRQELHHYGFVGDNGGFPEPSKLRHGNHIVYKPINAAILRQIIERFVERLEGAEATLALVPDHSDVLVIRLDQIRFDLDADGAIRGADLEWNSDALASILFTSQPRSWLGCVGFDAGDAMWLQGYCNAVLGICDIILAHDWRDAFERTGHLNFRKVESPYTFLHVDPRGVSMELLADAIAFVHLVNFEVIEPARMASARQHFLKTTQLGRAMWERIFAETDDYYEWLPSPLQKGVIIRQAVTDNSIKTWKSALAEAEEVLEGRKLLPFWRDPSVGIDLKAMFEEPRRLDLVLIVQGTALQPYLKQGDISSVETWQRLNREAGGDLWFLGLWYN